MVIVVEEVVGRLRDRSKDGGGGNGEEGEGGGSDGGVEELEEERGGERAQAWSSKWLSLNKTSSIFRLSVSLVMIFH